MSDGQHHPTREFSRMAAKSADGGKLEDAFELALNDARNISHSYAFGALEAVAAIAIARVKRLEVLFGYDGVTPLPSESRVVSLADHRRDREPAA